MEESSNPLDLLSWSTEAVNQLRTVLAAVNVPLPASLAQLLSVLVLGAVGWYLLGPARAPERSAARLAARVALAAAGLGIVSILVAWIDNLAAPRSEEIVGRVSPAGVAGVELELLDYQSEPLGASSATDSHGAFVVRYQPAFADPPSALEARAPGCELRRQPLRRAHLLGSPVQVRLSCEDGS